MFSLVIFLSFFALINFLLIFIFCMLMLFFPSCLFPCSALAFPNVAVRVSCKSARLKRLHWSTSSRLTAPPQPISRRGAVTSLQCASLAAMLSVLFTCTGENGLLSAGKHISNRTLLYVSVCHCCTPAWRSVNVK